MKHYDVAIIGGGQAALSVAYFLRRTKRSFIILDSETAPGAAWRHTWPSLKLFSPASWSSLAGWPMPSPKDSYPSAADVVSYFAQYEQRYALDVQRPHRVNSVAQAEEGGFTVQADGLALHCHAVVSATGTWSKPFIPAYPQADVFQGTQVHSAHYGGVEPYIGKQVLVVGGGNSGAQIHAELSEVWESTGVTPEPPNFLPDDVDGRVLFQRATERWTAQQEGRTVEPTGGFGDVVMVESVKAARTRGVLHAVRPFASFTPDGVVWPDGQTSPVDAVVWCTGFRPALDHLRALDVVDHSGRVAVQETRSIAQPHLWLVGYGEWTGMASATLIGVMRTARATAEQIDTSLTR